MIGWKSDVEAADTELVAVGNRCSETINSPKIDMLCIYANTEYTELGVKFTASHSIHCTAQFSFTRTSRH